LNSDGSFYRDPAVKVLVNCIKTFKHYFRKLLLVMFTGNTMLILINANVINISKVDTTDCVQKQV